VQEVATALREDRAPQLSSDLRTLQRSLANLLAMADQRQHAELLKRISDRLVDNVDTIVHVLARGQTETEMAPQQRRPAHR